MLQLPHVFQVPQAQGVLRAPTVPVVLPSGKVCREALGLWGCKGVAVALPARGGIANVMEIVELLGHTGDISLTNRLAGCCQGGSRPDPRHSIHWCDPCFLQESQDQKFSHGKTKFCDLVFAHAVLKY